MQPGQAQLSHTLSARNDKMDFNRWNIFNLVFILTGFQKNREKYIDPACHRKFKKFRKYKRLQYKINKNAFEQQKTL